MKKRGEKKEKKREKNIYIYIYILNLYLFQRNDEISRNAFSIVSPPSIDGGKKGKKEGRKEKKFPRETLEVLTNEISRSIVG